MNTKKIPSKKKVGRPKGTPKTGGRKKGTPNRVTANMRQFVYSLLEANQNQIVKDMKHLAAKDRLIIFERLLSYAIPKRAAHSVNFEDMTDDALDSIIDSLSDQIK